jgi:MFS family permease
MRRDLTILRERSFLLLFLARTLSVLGTSVGPVALAFGVLALPHATPTTLSLVLAGFSVSQVLFLLFAGVIADRFPRVRVRVGSDIASALAWAVVAVLLITGWAPVPLLVGLGVVAGLAGALFFPAMTGIVPELAPADRLQTANGLLRMGTNAARILGFAVAGGLVALLGPGPAMAVNAATYVASALLLGALKLPRLSRGGSTHMLADLREGWREFASRQWLWVVVLQFSFVVAGLEAFYGVLGPVVAQRDLGGAPAWSVVLAGESLGMFAGVFVALRIRPARPILLGVALTLPLALAPVLLGLRAPLLLVAAGAFVGGFCIDIFAVLWDTALQREVPPAALSRVSSYDALGSLMFGPIGLLAAGPLAGTVGPRPALLAAGATVVVPTLLALAAPGVRHLRAAPATEPAGNLVDEQELALAA